MSSMLMKSGAWWRRKNNKKTFLLRRVSCTNLISGHEQTPRLTIPFVSATEKIWHTLYIVPRIGQECKTVNHPGRPNKRSNCNQLLIVFEKGANTIQHWKYSISALIEEKKKLIGDHKVLLLMDRVANP